MTATILTERESRLACAVRCKRVVEADLAFLRDVGAVTIREMEKTKADTFCCGAGGGRMWMEENRGTRINAERTSQALATGASAVVTECPLCLTMLRDGLADAGECAKDVRTLDIAELLVERLVSPRAARKAAADMPVAVA